MINSREVAEVTRDLFNGTAITTRTGARTAHVLIDVGADHDDPVAAFAGCLARAALSDTSGAACCRPDYCARAVDAALRIIFEEAERMRPRNGRTAGPLYRELLRRVSARAEEIAAAAVRAVA